MIIQNKDIESIVGISLRTIQRMVRAGEFPQPIKLTARRVGFLVEEVEAWIQKQADKRSSD